VHGKRQPEQTISSASVRITCCAGLKAGFKARSRELLLPFNVSTTGAESRDSGSEQCVGLFNPLGKIEHRLKIIGINEILLAM
jgi:hypothetical protein